MDRTALLAAYGGYIDCLNRQDWDRLGDFVHEAAEHNGRALGLAGYREMLEGDFRAIPDLAFRADFVTCDPPVIGARLLFDCRPVGMLFGLAVNGRRVRFTENVFYRYSEGKIRRVWSLIDREAIAGQL